MAPPISRLEAFAHALVVVALMALHCAPAPGVMMWPDTVRDLSASLALARGESLPLAGPPINFGPRLGPAWIWLQSLVLLVAPSLAATSLYVAFVASLKFPLLYAFGRSVHGARLGLAFAVALAVPSIAVYQWWVFFHPNWVEAAVALSLLLGAIAWRKASRRWAFAAAVSLGLAIQMHPTALFYFPALALLLVAIGSRGWRLARDLAFAIVAVALWFLPLAFDRGPEGQWAQGASRIAAGVRAFQPADVPRTLWNAYVEIPLAIGDTYSTLLGGAVWIACLAIVGTAAALGMAMALASGRRRRLAALAAALLAAWVAIVGVREYTSFYLAYFLLPLQAVVLGLALHALLEARLGAARILGVIALAATTASFALASLGAAEVAAGGHLETTLAALSDLKTRERVAVSGTQMGVATRDAFARFACARSRVTLHGDLAFTLASSTSLDFRLHCPARPPEMTLLGPEPAQADAHWTSLPRAIASRLDKMPARLEGSLALFTVARVIHPPQGRPIETRWYHFDQLHDRQALQAVTHAFEAPAAEWLAVYRLKPFDSRWRLLAVECEGSAARPVFATLNGQVFRCASREGNAHWRVSFETDAPQWVDVHTF